MPLSDVLWAGLAMILLGVAACIADVLRRRRGGLVGILRDLFGAGTWGTGGNLVAAVILGALSLAGAWLGRHRIGRRAAAYWAKHHGPHAIEQHKQALREHEAEKRRGGDDGDQLPADDR